MQNRLFNAIAERMRKLTLDFYQNTSHDPVTTAQAVVEKYAKELWDDIQHMRKLSREPAASAAIDQTIYWNDYEKYLTAWLQQHATTAGALILDQSLEYMAFRQWRDETLTAFAKKTDYLSIELEQTRLKLEEKENVQRNIGAANNIVQEGGPDKYDQLRALGFSEETIFNIADTGFQPDHIRHNAGEISRLRSHIVILESKIQLAKNQSDKPDENNDVKLVHNYQTRRVQLIFDQRPDESIVTALQSQGFRSTPSQRSWQRKLTDKAIDAAEQIVKGIRSR